MLGNTQKSDWSVGDYLKVGDDGYLMKTNDYNEAVANVAISQS